VGLEALLAVFAFIIHAEEARYRMADNSGPKMYKDTKTWNAFAGCHFGCTYCGPSFRRQAKRQKNRCHDCYSFTPHRHEERLEDIPNEKTVFVSGNSDISFAKPTYTRKIIAQIDQRNAEHPEQTYYLQSKKPQYFGQFLDILPFNVILVTTLETNRDGGYRDISNAPLPPERYGQFRALDYPRKIITIEPVMDFDLDVFSRWIIDIDPECVYLGFNSRPKQVALPEPPEAKVVELAIVLREAGVQIREKDLRELRLPVPTSSPAG
jgi:hypothetical protein